MSTPKRPDNERPAYEFEKAVHEYLHRTGQLIPKTVEDVAAAEAWIAAHSVELPKRLIEAQGCSLSAPSQRAHVYRLRRTTSDVSQDLARAAREGGTISPEVEKRMKQDRDDKEREVDSGD